MNIPKIKLSDERIEELKEIAFDSNGEENEYWITIRNLLSHIEFISVKPE